MVLGADPGLVAGAVALGLVHGVEPGHGWRVAASYALDRANEWLYGFAASFVLGVGQPVSSIAMVVAFFWAKAYFSLTRVNEPIALASGVETGRRYVLSLPSAWGHGSRMASSRLSSPRLGSVVTYSASPTTTGDPG